MHNTVQYHMKEFNVCSAADSNQLVWECHHNK